MPLKQFGKSTSAYSYGYEASSVEGLRFNFAHAKMDPAADELTGAGWVAPFAGRIIDVWVLYDEVGIVVTTDDYEGVIEVKIDGTTIFTTAPAMDLDDDTDFATGGVLEFNCLAVADNFSYTNTAGTEVTDPTAVTGFTVPVLNSAALAFLPGDNILITNDITTTSQIPTGTPAAGLRVVVWIEPDTLVA